MNCDCYVNTIDKGPFPYVTNVAQAAMRNQNFRTAIWTGCLVQMTLMCIPPCGEIGLENHHDTDQIIRVEHGEALLLMGTGGCNLDYQKCLSKGDVVFVPAGTWHNVKNAGRCPLKVSSIYAPPNHPRGTLQRTRAEAEREGY